MIIAAASLQWMIWCNFKSFFCYFAFNNISPHFIHGTKSTITYLHVHVFVGFRVHTQIYIVIVNCSAADVTVREDVCGWSWWQLCLHLWLSESHYLCNLHLQLIVLPQQHLWIYDISPPWCSQGSWWDTDMHNWQSNLVKQHNRNDVIRWEIILINQRLELFYKLLFIHKLGKHWDKSLDTCGCFQSYLLLLCFNNIVIRGNFRFWQHQ